MWIVESNTINHFVAILQVLMARLVFRVTSRSTF